MIRFLLTVAFGWFLHIAMIQISFEQSLERGRQANHLTCHNYPDTDNGRNNCYQDFVENNKTLIERMVEFRPNFIKFYKDLKGE